MAFNPKTLRMVFAAIGAVVLVAVLGFYGYARYRVNKAVQGVPKKLGIDIQQSATGFKISKSEAGRMLFSISASSAVQYKGGQRATLKDARIIVYNHGKGTNDPATDMYDQIYGKEFDYDHSTGDISAAGDVLIDLQAKGVPPEDPARTTASPGALHLKTSGLTFNEKTGVAETDKPIEFGLPQGNGSAVGAFYDSKMMTVHLKSNVKVRTIPGNAAEKRSGAITITADNADIFDMPREAILSGVHFEDGRKTRSMSAGRLTLSMRDDNTIERALATEGVKGAVKDASGNVTALESNQADLVFGASNDIKAAFLSGAVKMDSKAGAKGDTHAAAGKAEFQFGAKTQLERVHATESVALSNTGGQNDGFILNAPGVDFVLKPGNRLDHAVTFGAAQIVLDAKSTPGAQRASAHTVATADKFEAMFAPAAGVKNKLQSVHGSGHTKVVSSSAGNPDRTTTGRALLVKFDAKTGSAGSVEQSGDFKYVEDGRNASAEAASFDMTSDQVTLNGSPRVQDTTQGLSLTADKVKMNRKSGDVNADGNVKATYNQGRLNPNGAMFSGQSGGPVHATSESMTASKATGIANFIGKARLWQGANLVEAPQITFDKEHRNVTADGRVGQVQTAFVQTDAKGKVTPVSVTAAKLFYSDGERKARFEGGIRLKTADMTMVADHADVFLKPQSARSAAGKDSASQIDRIEAAGQIVIEEENPARKVTGSRLVYTADEGKVVMTGEPGKSPSIFDAERGDLTGDSLTFYIHDDRVQVGSGENSRIVTRTRIKDERKP